MSDTHPEPIEQLAEAIGHARKLLDLVLFKLISTRLLIAAGQTRWITDAAAEVAAAVGAFQAASADWRDRAATVAATYGVTPDEVTIPWLAAEAPEPWRTMFVSHEEALRQLGGEIARVAAENREMADAAMEQVTQLLGGGPAVGQTYTRTGQVAGRRPGQHNFDGII
jgi:hypothetical protein